MLSRMNPWSSERRARRQQLRLGNAVPCPPASIRPGRSHVDRPPDARQESCRFFMILPPELRRRILVDAFGDRTLHMDLQFRLPFAPIPPGAEGDTTRSHAGVYFDDPYEGAIMDQTASEEWRWFGCVCHARPGHEMRFFDPPRPRGLPGPLNIDRCLHGEALCPRPAWRETHDPAPCVIGAMGWLLSCRQAPTRLVEGLDVLYGTNTIRISSVPIIYNLELFVPPPQLQRIISLDLDLLVAKKPARPVARDPESRFVSSVSIPPTKDFSFPFLPCLRYLHLAVERHYDLDSLHPTHNAKAVIQAIPSLEERRRRRRRMIESQLLVHLDAWIYQMAPGGAECDVSVPETMFEAVCRGNELAGPRSKRGVTCEIARWRQIDTGRARNSGQPGRCPGYWIQGGLWDKSNLFVCTLGSGAFAPDT